MSRYKASVTIFPRDRGGPAVMPVGSGDSPHTRTTNGEALPIILHDVPPSATFDTALEAVIELRYPGHLDYSTLMSGQELELVGGAGCMSQ